MKQITVYFENEEMEKLKEIKGDRSWHDVVMSLVEEDED